MQQADGTLPSLGLVAFSGKLAAGEPLGESLGEPLGLGVWGVASG